MSVDDQVSEEWTTAADGPHKRQRASDLAARLKAAWAPQGLIQRGQGKWYPGEPLPRWQIALYWRTDGHPVWHDDALLADPGRRPADDPPGRRGGVRGAGRHRRGVRTTTVPGAARLRGPVVPAGGQGAHARRRAGGPESTDLAARLPRRPRRAAGAPRRIRRHPGGVRAAAAPPRRRPGLGQRRLAAAPRPHRAAARGLAGGPAPAAGLDQLETAAPVVRGRSPDGGAHELATDAAARRWSTAADTAPPTAMVAEVRDGLLYVFMPPTEALEHFLDLIARVEIAAAKADCPVVIEGYDPPPDPRLKSTTITADPGVIEVNVAPSASFAEQRQLLETLYAAGPSCPIIYGVVRRRRHARRHRRRQPHHTRRRHARGLTVAAPSRPAGLATDVLAAAPVAVLPVRRAVRRHHLAGAAGGRGPRRGALRTRDRVRRDRRGSLRLPGSAPHRRG